jgi:signal transduction histidine kinase
MRWFCGGFIWSNKAIRLLHKDSELSFLRAFGMSIMSEVAKLDTAMADRAKSDLLNSISHELRSPLHGILGSIECLESTDLDPMQHGLVETVDTCGRTLLDTINHLLDFSKINNFTRNKSKRQKNSESRQADMLSLDSTVHLRDTLLLQVCVKQQTLVRHPRVRHSIETWKLSLTLKPRIMRTGYSAPKVEHGNA